MSTITVFTGITAFSISDNFLYSDQFEHIFSQSGLLMRPDRAEILKPNS